MTRPSAKRKAPPPGSTRANAVHHVAHVTAPDPNPKVVLSPGGGLAVGGNRALDTGVPHAAAATGKRAARLARRRKEQAEDLVSVRRILGGDPEAFRHLVERYQKPLFWIARDILLDRDEALDVVQECFVRVHAALHRFDQSRSFKNWIFRIARNLAIDMYRRRRRRPGSVEDPAYYHDASPDRDRTGAQGSAASAATLDELKARVNTVMESLPVEYRLALTLRDFHGLTPREIARVADCSYATARWRLHRARGLFRAAWQERFGSELPVSVGGVS